MKKVKDLLVASFKSYIGIYHPSALYNLSSRKGAEAKLAHLVEFYNYGFYSVSEFVTSVILVVKNEDLTTVSEETATELYNTLSLIK